MTLLDEFVDLVDVAAEASQTLTGVLEPEAAAAADADPQFGVDGRAIAAEGVFGRKNGDEESTMGVEECLE